MHQHPNNLLSGVYYVRTHPGADTMNFHDPRNQSASIRRASGNERTRRPVALQIASVTSAVVMTAKARIGRCAA
jgi:Putative 2OG-Fe(II) oxygenase